MTDMINHPSHYTRGKIEVIDFIEDWCLGYHLGNAVKYICRAGYKGDRIEDLEKAYWYLNRYVIRNMNERKFIFPNIDPLDFARDQQLPIELTSTICHICNAASGIWLLNELALIEFSGYIDELKHEEVNNVNRTGE